MERRNPSYIITTSNGELYHHGILGMKWGIRRYQNADGTRTDVGKRRRRAHEDYINAHSHKRIKDMSTKELNDRNNRLTAEKNYRENKLNNNIIFRGAKLATKIVAAYGAYKLLFSKGAELRPQVKTGAEMVANYFRIKQGKL